jgi:pyrimidine operon attenuation protein/uracil phosphoribosyltransferase
MNQNIILNHLEIDHKIKRIAYQIFETFAEEKEIILAGIACNGYVFAEKIGAILKNRRIKKNLFLLFPSLSKRFSNELKSVIELKIKNN